MPARQLLLLASDGAQALSEQAQRPACGRLIPASVVFQGQQELEQGKRNAFHAIGRIHSGFSLGTTNETQCTRCVTVASKPPRTTIKLCLSNNQMRRAFVMITRAYQASRQWRRHCRRRAPAWGVSPPDNCRAGFGWPGSFLGQFMLNIILAYLVLMLVLAVFVGRVIAFGMGTR